jgi:outer membrane protein TolC
MTMGERRIAAGCFALACSVLAGRAGAQTVPGPPLTLVLPEGQAAPPLVITWLDALERARANDAQFQSAITDAKVAGEERAQAHAALFPAISATTQYLGTQGDTPLPPDASSRTTASTCIGRGWSPARNCRRTC